MSAKNSVRGAAFLAPVRWLTKSVLNARRVAGRVGNVLRTAALFPSARGVVCHRSVEVKFPENVTFAGPAIIGPGCVLGAASPIHLGLHARLSKDVLLETAGLDFSVNALPYKHVSKPIRIGDGVWIGARAIILGGVEIGERSVVAAGSVVTRSVPPNTIVAGVPAKQVGRTPL